MNIPRVFILLIILLFSTTFRLKGQPDRLYFNVEGVEGVIFPDGAIMANWVTISKFSVIDLEEILYVDSLARQFILSYFTDSSLVQQGFDNCPIISESWNEYKRQIIKYVDDKSGDQILMIQYLHNQVLSHHPKWQESWNLTSGGCSNYWGIEFNLKSKELFNFYIN